MSAVGNTEGLFVKKYSSMSKNKSIKIGTLNRSVSNTGKNR